MYAYQRSNYAGGDYYTGASGNYAAGGLFGFIGKAIGGVAKAVGSVVPGPIGAIAKTAGGILSGGSKSTALTTVAPPIPTFNVPVPVPKGTPGAMPVPGIGGTVQRFLPGGASGYEGGAGQAPSGWHWNKSHSYAKGLPPGSFLVRNRHMNPLNPRALRHALRREGNAIKLFKRAVRGTGITVSRHRVGSKTRRRR